VTYVYIGLRKINHNKTVKKIYANTLTTAENSTAVIAMKIS